MAERLCADSRLKNAIYAEMIPIDTILYADYFKHKCQKMAKAFAISIV